MNLNFEKADLEILNNFLPYFWESHNLLKVKYIDVEKQEMACFFEKLHPFIRKEEAINAVNLPLFNIFGIMRYGHYETRLHTPFLVSLLTPSPIHHQGNLFMEAFLSQILGNKIQGKQIQILEVIEEFSIGDLGRIDIFIKLKVDYEYLLIAIENKINALDQYKQLERYYKYLNGKTHNFMLIYLTKFGIPPSIPDSIDIDTYNELLKREKLYLASYCSDIIIMLSKCLLSIKQEPLKIILRQYISTIKHFK